MRNVSPAILVDTNVLVYVYDPRDQVKQRQAAIVLDKLLRTEQVVLSVQCLTEFFNTVTRRLPEPLTPAEASVRVERLTRLCRVLELTPLAVLECCRGTVEHRLSFWDALIWTVAKRNRIPYLLTEDAKHGRFLEGVRFLKPFDPAFDLDALSSGP